MLAFSQGHARGGTGRARATGIRSGIAAAILMCFLGRAVAAVFAVSGQTIWDRAMPPVATVARSGQGCHSLPAAREEEGATALRQRHARSQRGCTNCTVPGRLTIRSGSSKHSQCWPRRRRQQRNPPRERCNRRPIASARPRRKPRPQRKSWLQPKQTWQGWRRSFPSRRQLGPQPTVLFGLRRPRRLPRVR